MSNYRVVVLMSTYNGEKYIEMQLDSIFSQQTDASIELIVRDDGSSDSTLDIIRKWANKYPIEILESDTNVGPAASFWTLLLNAKEADYYAFSDQDDCWDVNKIQSAIDEIGNDKTPVLWASNCRIIDENSKTTKARYRDEIPELTVVSQFICGSAQGCSMVLNRSAVEAIRAYNPPCDPMHDLVIMEYMLVIGKVIYNEHPFFSYRVHQNNVVAKQDKGIMHRIKSFGRWFNKYKYSYSRLAAKMLEDLSGLMDEDTNAYMTHLTGCRNSLIARFKVLSDERTHNRNKRALRSFRIRVGLGII